MKKLLLVFSIFIVFILGGCLSSDSYPEVESTVKGTWNSYYISDSNDNEIQNTQINLLLSQQNKEVSGIFNIVEDNITVESVEINGTLGSDGFTLKGNSTTNSYMLNGFLEDSEDSLQVTRVKNYNSKNESDLEIWHILLHLEKPEILLSDSRNPNEIKCHCNCDTENEDNIILIHGWNQGAGVWDNFINQLKGNEVCKEFSVWTYQYDWKEHIEKIAQDMIARVNYSVGDKDPILIGHNMGGLVARSYISKYGYFKRLITLGTPHWGTDLHYASYQFYDGIRDAHSDQHSASDFLKALNGNNFEKWQRGKYLLLNGRIGYTWGCTKTCTTFWGKSYCCKKWWKGNSGNYPAHIDVGYHMHNKPNDGMVDEDSALFTGGGSEIQRVSGDKFQWQCNDWLPYNNQVENYLINNLLENK